MRNYFVYGVLGWCLEILWTGLASLIAGDPRLTAKTYLWMFPIYGLAIFFEPIHNYIRRQPAVVRGILWMLTFFATEYFTGWLLRTLVGAIPWDYSNTRFQIHGLIRLDYAPVWFVVGLLFEKVHDWLEQSDIR